MALDELIHKKRTIADLIRFIGNTTESDDNGTIKTPNYSILLGAGASITSGIRSGQTLIKDWKQEVYDELNTDENVTIEEYFMPGKAPSWYEESNAYSVLFENRFDLQRHRRMFVEREVSNAKPSMGYAYLVKLIENGFFNTVFTTNFDDLLNEAFYRFSNNRPIVCAHDSSISGVTVTSTRPKIIKLHGDYLYENIKATLRETESLETNMKLKFQEFAKDFGLIVIGYSGQDRSIMDILNYLLQKEDYFKNGIFWCIKKGDYNISNELKKLLWKDRVYYVEIDGFDELFAELNHRLNKGQLPVDDKFLSIRHQESIIEELTDNPLMNPKGNCKILTDDCNRLKNNFENNKLNDYLNYVKKDNQLDPKKAEAKIVKRKNKLKAKTPEESRVLADLVTEGFVKNHVNSALQKLSKMEIASLEDGEYKLELLELLADLTKNLSDDAIKGLFDELIRLDPDNEKYYVISAIRSRSHIQAIKYLEQAVTRFPNDEYIINKLVDRILDYCDDDCSCEEQIQYLNKVEELLSRSLSLYSDPGNSAYISKNRYLTIKYQDDLQTLVTKKEELLESIRNLSQYHPNTLELMQDNDSNELNDKYFRDAITFYKQADYSRNVEKCYMRFICWKYENDTFDNVLKIFEEFETDYSGSNDYQLMKASVLMENEYFEDALLLYNELPDDLETTQNKCDILANLGRYDELDKLYEASEYKDDLKLDYLLLRGLYDEELAMYEKMQKEKGTLSTEEAIGYAYTLLLCKDYESVKKLLEPYYYSPYPVPGAVIVNYLYAQKQLGVDVDKQIKAKMLGDEDNDYSDLEKFGAYCVLKDNNKAYTLLKKIINEEPIQKYSINNWPIMASFRNDNKIMKLLEPNLKRLNS